jgi:DNA-binding response OmpR family regulator
MEGPHAADSMLTCPKMLEFSAEHALLGRRHSSCFDIELEHKGIFALHFGDLEKGVMSMSAMRETMRREPFQGAHILLVEDEPNVAKGLQMVLNEQGYEVDLAMTGLSALEAFHGNGFNLVVADLRLPDIDGMEVLKEISEERPETKMLIITGYPSVSSAVTAVKMGVTDYLRKPFTEEEFKSAVAGALKTKQGASMEELLLETEEGRLIQKREVTRVLNRTVHDSDFWDELMETGSDALKGYRLTRRAKAAIISGDVEWLRKHVGDLSEKQLQFIYKRLEREDW